MTFNNIKRFLAALLVAISAHPLSALNPTAIGFSGGPVYTNQKALQSPDDDITSSRSNAITRAVRKCSPAVVGINVTETRTQYYGDPFADFFSDPFYQHFYGNRPRVQRRDYEVRSLGSGFLISADGYILTNDHVAGNASKIVVTMTDGSKHDAKVVGTDPVTDVALLKIDGSGFPYLRLANSNDVEVGEWAIAFGNPFGLFDNNAKPTVTVGVVSNTGVSFTQNNDLGGRRVYKDMLQTDAAISSGNSGGPLVNANGEAIGVNTVIFSTALSNRGSGSIGIGFSIPINRVRQIVDRLQKSGSIDRDYWTGMNLVAIDANVKNYFNLSTTDGVLVSKVASDSPADVAGIEPGDVIIAIEGKQTITEEDLNLTLLDGEVNQKLSLTVLRGSTNKQVTMTLKKRPKSGGIRN